MSTWEKHVEYLEEEADDGYPVEMDDYYLQCEEEEAEWDGWTDQEIREFLAQDLIDEMRLQALIEKGEAE